MMMEEEEERGRVGRAREGRVASEVGRWEGW